MARKARRASLFADCRPIAEQRVVLIAAVAVWLLVAGVLGVMPARGQTAPGGQPFQAPPSAGAGGSDASGRRLFCEIGVA
jgi:hypothetical protein